MNTRHLYPATSTNIIWLYMLRKINNPNPTRRHKFNNLQSAIKRKCFSFFISRCSGWMLGFFFLLALFLFELPSSYKNKSSLPIQPFWLLNKTNGKGNKYMHFLVYFLRLHKGMKHRGEKGTCPGNSLVQGVFKLSGTIDQMPASSKIILWSLLYNLWDRNPEPIWGKMRKKIQSIQD